MQAVALAWALISGPSAWAARAGVVDVEGAEVFEGPGKGYRLVDKLHKGAQVAASNIPTEGFLKIRTTTGVVGWVQADALVLGGEGESAPSPDSQQAVVPGPASTAQDFRSERQRKFIRIKMLGGATLFNAQDVNERLRFDGIRNGVQYGGEVTFMFTNDLGMVIRVERLIKNLVAEDDPTNKTYQLDAGSFPVMAGVELALAKTPKFVSHFAMMAGLGIQTELRSTGLDFVDPNVTVFSDYAFTGLVKLSFSWMVFRNIGLFAEGGYRILRSRELLPSPAGNGKEIFEVNHATTAMTLDFSGAVVGGGVTFAF